MAYVGVLVAKYIYNLWFGKFSGPTPVLIPGVPDLRSLTSVHFSVSMNLNFRAILELWYCNLFQAIWLQNNIFLMSDEFLCHKYIWPYCTCG